MPQSYAAWRATYTPGSWVVLAGPSSLVLLQPAPAAMSTLLTSIWDAVVEAASVHDLVSILSSYGLDQMPDLGLFFWDEQGMHSLVRGQVQVIDPRTHELVNTGEGVITWSERGVPQRLVRVELEQTEVDQVLHLPLLVGAVTASSIVLDATATSQLHFGGVPAAQPAQVETADADPVVAPAVVPDDQAFGQYVEESDQPAAVEAVDSADAGEPVDAPEPDQEGQDQAGQLPAETEALEQAQPDPGSGDQQEFEAAAEPDVPVGVEPGDLPAETLEPVAEIAPSATQADEALEQPAAPAQLFPGQTAPIVQPSAPQPLGGATVGAAGVAPAMPAQPGWQPSAGAPASAAGIPGGQPQPGFPGAPQQPAWPGQPQQEIPQQQQIPQQQMPQQWQQHPGQGQPEQQPWQGQQWGQPQQAPMQQAPVQQPPARSEQQWAPPAPVEQYQAAPQASAEPRPEDGLVLASICAAGHANPPGSFRCRLCPAPVNGASQQWVNRPVLAVLRVSSGETLDLVGPVVIGRAPAAAPNEPSLTTVKVPSPSSDISRNHLRVVPEGWAIVATDLHSTNGTLVHRRGEGPIRLNPGEGLAVQLGDILDLGDGISIEVAPPA